MKKIGLICLALVLAVGAIGFGYAHWLDTVYIDATVESGTFEIIFTDAMSNDPPDDVSLDPKEAGEWTLDTPFSWAGDRWDKDVGSLEVTGAPGSALTVTLDNGYPGYFPSVGFTIDNPGTIPAKIESIKIDDTDYTCPVQVYFDFDNDGNIDTELRVWGIDVGQQIDPGDEVLGHLDLRIYQEAAMQASQCVSGGFEVSIVATQWNKVAAKTITAAPSPAPGPNTIQAAIVAANAGDTVIVSAGTYEPDNNVIIPDGVTLKLQSGVIVKFAWDVVGGNYYGNGFVVEDGGTFLADDAKICKQDGAEWGGYLVRFEAGSSGHVKNCTIQSGLELIQLWGASGITIENNLMQVSASFMINLYNADGNTIKDNICLGTPQANIGLTGSDNNIVIGNKLYPYWYLQNNGIDVCTESYNNQILNNTVTGVDPYGAGGTINRGICINVGSHDTTVHGNEVYGITYHGISLFGTSTNTVITGNDIHDNGETGIILEAGGATGVAVHQNNIYGNGEYGIKVEYVPVAPVDAINNWWGDASGPFPVGTGDAVSDHVLYDPWATAPY